MSILGQPRAGFHFRFQLLLTFPVVEGQASRPALVSQVGSFHPFLPLSTSLTEHADESVWGYEAYSAGETWGHYEALGAVTTSWG